jgi:hypothetical protein
VLAARKLKSRDIAIVADTHETGKLRKKRRAGQRLLLGKRK